MSRRLSIQHNPTFSIIWHRVDNPRDPARTSHPANLSEAFEQSVTECYPETVKIGWIEYDTVSALKELDPVSWSLALSEYADTETSEGNIVTFDNGECYYWAREIEQFIVENAPNSEASSSQ